MHPPPTPKFPGKDGLPGSDSIFFRGYTLENSYSEPKKGLLGKEKTSTNPPFFGVPDVNFQVICLVFGVIYIYIYIIIYNSFG